MKYNIAEEDQPVADMMQKYRSRKWRLTLMLLFVAVALTAAELLTDNMTQIIITLGASYNAAQGLIDWQKSKL